MKKSNRRLAAGIVSSESYNIVKGVSCRKAGKRPKSAMKTTKDRVSTTIRTVLKTPIVSCVICGRSVALLSGLLRFSVAIRKTIYF